MPGMKVTELSASKMEGDWRMGQKNAGFLLERKTFPLTPEENFVEDTANY